MEKHKTYSGIMYSIQEHEINLIIESLNELYNKKCIEYFKLYDKNKLLLTREDEDQKWNLFEDFKLIENIIDILKNTKQ